MELLCAHCSEFFPSRDLTPALGGVSHHQTIGALHRSAANCALCKTIYDFSGLTYLRNRFPDIAGHGSDPLPVELEVLNVGHSKTTGILWFILRGEISVEHHKYGASFDITVTTAYKMPGYPGPATHSPLWRDQDSSFQQKCMLIKSWLNECMSNHPDCSAPLDGKKPTRLIYVGSESQNPRLVDMESEPPRTMPVYAALSHCWGTVRPLELSKKNMSEMQDQIPLNSFPKTFREAIRLMRQIGVPYLWIDSLCIIQDDPEDWVREAARMMQVYSGSSIVVSAEDSQNCTLGCFIDAEQDLSDPASREPIRMLSAKPQGWGTALDLRVYNHHVKRPWTTNVLRTRGWALQEQLLAHREVICTRPELRWRCQRMQKTETGHEFALKNSLYRDILGSTLPEKKWLWCDWMSDYSTRDFTFPSDRLSALAGIIHHYSQRTGYEHVLACWRETMIDDLLWLRGRHPISSTKSLPSIPSWSWLSRANSVDFDMWNRAFGDRRSELRQEDSTAVIEAGINWAGEPMLSTLLSSTLFLEGPLQDMILCIDQRALEYNPPYLNVGYEELEVKRVDQGGDPIPWRCAGQFDNEIMREDHRYMCLLMRTSYLNEIEPGSSQQPVFSVAETFLILTRELNKDGNEVFRRLGMAMIRGKESSFSSALRTRIRLV